MREKYSLYPTDTELCLWDYDLSIEIIEIMAALRPIRIELRYPAFSKTRLPCQRHRRPNPTLNHCRRVILSEQP